MRLSRLLLILLGITGLFSSCSTPKNIAYFPDLADGEVITVQQAKPIVVQPDDKLSIIVNSKDGSLADLFNLPITSRRVGTQSNSGATATRNYISSNEGISYYTVDPDGNIDFPVIGKIHVAGMTRSQLASDIKKRLVADNYVKDPVVTVEFISTGISIMGEVTSPGRYDINRDRLTILEALAMAGDLTIQGQRENVLVIRPSDDGTQTAYRVNLTDGEKLIKSPVFYLQPNDIVYVEPNSFKKRQTTVNGNNVLNASFWVSVASLLTSVAVLIFK